MSKATTAVVLGAGALLFGSVGMATSLVPSSRIENALKKEIPNPEYSNTFDKDDLPEVYKAFGQQYKAEILDAAAKYDVPPEYIMAVIVEENYARKVQDDIFDNLALACGLDPSLGIGQVRRSVAKKLTKEYNNQDLNITDLIYQLQDTGKNIDYIAMNLADLTHPQNSQPPHGDYFGKHYTAIVGTRYVKGQTDTPILNARPSCEGMHFVYYLSTFPSRRIFGETDQRITEAQQRELLHYSKAVLPTICKDPSPKEHVQILIAKI